MTEQSTSSGYTADLALADRLHRQKLYDQQVRARLLRYARRVGWPAQTVVDASERPLHRMAARKAAPPPAPAHPFAKWPFICPCQTALVEPGSYDGQVELVPPPFLQGSGTERGISVDACLALEISNLWKLGIQTLECCCGHGRRAPYIAVIPEHAWLMRDLEYAYEGHMTNDDPPVLRTEIFVAKSLLPNLRV